MGDMIQQKWGRTINIASTAATVGYVAHSALLRVQGGLLGLTRCVALEGAPHGTSCNISSRVCGTAGTLWPLPGGLRRARVRPPSPDRGTLSQEAFLPRLPVRKPQALHLIGLAASFMPDPDVPPR